jgi:3',5'-cyclic-nucleotide phosphodiesterase
MDHIATLPIFIDDLYPSLQQPMRIYATEEVIGLLERDVFNWNVYPRFSDLKNDYGPVMEYVPIPIGKPFPVAHLTVCAVPVNHIVPTVGLVVSDGQKSVAFSSDTAETDEFWKIVNEMKDLDARHFTPATLGQELKKLTHNGMDIMAVHLKPSYRDEIVEQLRALNIPKLSVMEPGRVYEW